MKKRYISLVLAIAVMLTQLTGVVWAGSSNDGSVYTDTWVPGVDNGASGDPNKLSVESVTGTDGNYYLYTSVNGKSDAPIIYKQRTVALFEMTFMLTDSGSKLLYMPVFYDNGKGSENWDPIMTVSETGGVVINNIEDSGSNKIFAESESGWSNGKYTFLSSVTMNKKHTIRVEHNPDALTFTIRFDGHCVTLAENPDSEFVLSTATGSTYAHNAKGPRFAFAASSGQSMRVYDIYIRGTVATNTSSAKAKEVFTNARPFTYEGELKVTGTVPADGAYGVKYDARDIHIVFNRPLAPSPAEDFGINILCTLPNGEEETLSPESYSCLFDEENSKLDITLAEDMKRGAKYSVEISNVYSDEGNPISKFSFSFTTDDGTAEILDGVNASTGMRALGQVLDTYKSDIGLADSDYTDINTNRNVISWIFANKPYSDVNSIRSAAETAATVMAELDASDESDLEEFIVTYKDILFDNTDVTEKYNEMSDIHRIMVNTMVQGSKPFATLIDFADYFEECVSSISADIAPDSDEADKLICDFTLTGMQGWVPSKENNDFIKASTPDFAQGITLGRYYIPEKTTDQYRMDFPLSYSDVSDCDTLYMWAYSPEASDKQYAIMAYCGNNDAGQWVDFRKVMKIDFEGWKLITVPLSSFSATRNPSWSSLVDFRFAQAGMGITEAAEDTEIYFARIWFGKGKSQNGFELTDSNAYDGTTGFGIGDSAEFVFSDKVYFNPGNPPYITDGSGARVDADVTSDGNTLVITPASKLSENSTYTVHLNGVCTYGGEGAISDTHTFTTSGRGLYAGVPEFSTASLPQSGSVCAAVTLGNTSDKQLTAELVLAVYDKNGRMIKAETNEITVAGGESDKSLLCFTDLDSYDGVTLKAFTVNKSDNCKPVNKKAAVLADADAPADKVHDSFDKDISFADGNLGIRNINVNIDTISIESCVSQNISVPITVRVYDSEDNLIYINHITTDTSGCATVEFTLDPTEDMGGKYTVFVSSDSMTNSRAAAGYFYYLDSDSKAQITDKVNSASSENKVASVLNENKALMSLADIDYTASENMYISHVIFRDKPYSSYSEIIEKLNDSVTALEKINSSYWSAYSDIVEEYRDIIFDEMSVYNSFTKLSASRKNKVSQNAYTKRPFKSFGDFADAIEGAVDSTDIPSSGGGSSSGGSSGGGSSLPTGGYTVATPTVSNTANESYTDLGDSIWAEEYIYALKEKGVLTMGADRRFRPNDNITREEFVKMLVVSLGITAQGDVSFEDVSGDAWYYTYIAAAFNAGIVNGVDAQHFGIGEYITREQMAAMACRALDVTDYQGSTDGIFADDADISDYAKASVYHMQSNGIINGMGGNVFAPKAKLSRAQAAKVIAMILEL